MHGAVRQPTTGEDVNVDAETAAALRRVAELADRITDQETTLSEMIDQHVATRTAVADARATIRELRDARNREMLRARVDHAASLNALADAAGLTRQAVAEALRTMPDPST